MKQLLQLSTMLLLMLGTSSFLKPAAVDETLDVWAGPGMGAHEVVIYVTRSGAEAGQHYVSFDVDLMIDYQPEHVQTFHVDAPAGFTFWYWNYYSNWVVGTDATVVGSIYNVTYY